MLIGIGSASDIPFEFSDNSLNLASYSSGQLEEESALSKDLNGVPVITMPSNSDILEIPVTGGGSTSEGKLKKKVADLKDELNKKVEPDNPQINEIAVKLAAKYPGDLRVDQICEVYYYLKYGDDAKNAWRYVRDIRGIDSWKYANSSIKMGSDIGCVGLGDCDDFAILMSALVESIGGATRIILASNNTVGGHAYTEVYLGQLDDPNNQAEEIIQWLREEYDNEKIFGHVDTDTKEAWLNLDWGLDSKGNAHPGGPLFKGDEHYVLRVRDEYKLIPLRMPEATNMPPRLISLTPDQASPQVAGSVIVWTAKAKDPEDDKTLYRFILNGYAKTRWISESFWEWTTTEADIGDSQVEVQIRDGKHKGPNSFDGNKVDSYSILEQEIEESATPIDQSTNMPPGLISLIPDQPYPQEAGSVIVWTANAKDPEDDEILYRFILNGDAVTSWMSGGSWTWITTEADIGDNQVEVQIRDGKHKGPISFDGNKVDSYSILEQEIEESATPIDQSWNEYTAAENASIATAPIDQSWSGYAINDTIINATPIDQSWSEYAAAENVTPIDEYWGENRPIINETVVKGNATINESWGENDPAYTWFFKGIALSNQGKNEEAIQAYDKAIEINPQFEEAWLNKGYALYNQGKNEEAIQAHDKAIEINPQFEEAWLNKGYVLSNQGKNEEALQAYDRAIEINPQSSAWNSKGLVLSVLGRDEEALQAYDKAVEIHPQDSGAWHNRGTELQNMGRYEEAIKSFDKAIELMESQYAAWTWYYKGQALEALGRSAEAESAYSRARELGVA